MDTKGSDHFRDILNPYGEKSNYGKIGRRRRRFKLNDIFPIHAVGDHMYKLHVYIYIYMQYLHIYIYTVT